MATTLEVHVGELLERKRATLASLASDQLFRRQFIDPKMPGYKGKPEEVDLGKALVGRMLLITDGGTRRTTSALAHSSSSK